VDPHKNTRGLSTLGYGQHYPPRSPLSNDKKINRASLRHLSKIFLFFDDMFDFEDLRYFGRKEGEGVGGEVLETS
jgi:hypothetical protein